jgi:hypothetical protein
MRTHSIFDLFQGHSAGIRQREKARLHFGFEIERHGHAHPTLSAYCMRHYCAGRKARLHLHNGTHLVLLSPVLDIFPRGVLAR